MGIVRLGMKPQLKRRSDWLVCERLSTVCETVFTIVMP